MRTFVRAIYRLKFITFLRLPRVGIRRCLSLNVKSQHCFFLYRFTSFPRRSAWTITISSIIRTLRVSLSLASSLLLLSLPSTTESTVQSEKEGTRLVVSVSAAAAAICTSICGRLPARQAGRQAGRQAVIVGAKRQINKESSGPPTRHWILLCLHLSYMCVHVHSNQSWKQAR
jgi:hypothetical protein